MILNLSSGIGSDLNFRTDRRELIPSCTVISRGMSNQISPKVKDSRAPYEIVQLPGSRNERLKIAVDLDAVLAETREAWSRHANQFPGTNLKLADLEPGASCGKLGINSEQLFQLLDEAWYY